MELKLHLYRALPCAESQFCTGKQVERKRIGKHREAARLKVKLSHQMVSEDDHVHVSEILD